MTQGADMNLRVSAANITALTGDAGPAGYAHAPTPEKMIKRIRRRLQENIEASKTDSWPHAENMPRISSDDARVEAVTAARDFEKILKDLPPGFKLTPVLYTRVSREDAHEIDTEFTVTRPRFLSFLGERHSDQLRAMGLDDHAINRMKKGLDPVDANNKAFYLNVDHIIERAGSGTLVKVKSRDPDCTCCEVSVSPVNHFGNLMLLPGQIHAAKNRLNEIQGMRSIKEGESRWILMMIPECPGDKPRFVTPPLPQSHPLGGLITYAKDPKATLGHAFKMTQRIAGAMKNFAYHQRQNVNLKDEAFSRKFGGFFSAVFQDACDRILEAFNSAADKTRGHTIRPAVDRFKEFFHGRELDAIEQNANLLPDAEADAFDRTIQVIMQKMQKQPGHKRHHSRR